MLLLLSTLLLTDVSVQKKINNFIIVRLHKNLLLSGFTEQYRDFNPVVNKYANLGLYIAAFPCNQFDLQEPGENSEILNGIKYVRPGNGFTPAKNLHIYGKLNVNGDEAHPMYKFLKVTSSF